MDNYIKRTWLTTHDDIVVELINPEGQPIFFYYYSTEGVEMMVDASHPAFKISTGVRHHVFTADPVDRTKITTYRGGNQPVIAFSESTPPVSLVVYLGEVPSTRIKPNTEVWVEKIDEVTTRNYLWECENLAGLAKTTDEFWGGLLPPSILQQAQEHFNLNLTPDPLIPSSLLDDEDHF